MSAKQVDVLGQVIPLRCHGLHQLDGCPGVVHCPVAVDGVRQAVGFNGVAEFMRIIPAIPVDRQGIQKPGLFQNVHQPEGPQEPKQEILALLILKQ